jgi:hypothetical protein
MGRLDGLILRKDLQIILLSDAPESLFTTYGKIAGMIRRFNGIVLLSMRLQVIFSAMAIVVQIILITLQTLIKPSGNRR